MAQINAYTTSYGTTVPAQVLSDLIADILNGIDSQRSVTDHLRDIIPIHEQDLDEAMEVYNHAEEVFHDNNLCPLAARVSPRE